ncbi:MAG: hypothetical protein Q4C43_09310 [Prevotella sp.]|nr:hypothetical protein [Prevotella sp.]
MNKARLLLIILLAGCADVFAMTSSERIVQRFGNNMAQWCSTKSIDYRMAALKDCHNKDGKKKNECMVMDYLMDVEAQKSSLSNNHYVIQDYLLVFQNALRSGNTSFRMYNIEEIPYGSIEIENYSSRKKSSAKTLTYVSCDIDVSGALNYKLKNLFIISDEGKIWKIESHKEVINQRTGEKRTLVNIDELVEDNETMGFSYNYGQHFPVGGSFNYSLAKIPLMLSFDFGINLDGDKYVLDKVEMTDIMHFDRTKKVRDPKFFLTVTPQLYFRYFAIGCGVGFLYMDGTKYDMSKDIDISDFSSEGFVSSSEHVSAEAGEEANCPLLKPMIRPVAKGFIPLNDEMYMSVSVGYDLIFGYKEKNGLNFGLGLQWEL